MINIKDNSDVKGFIEEKIMYLTSEIDSDKAEFDDTVLSQQARGRVARGEWALKVLNQIKDMLI